MSIPENVDAWAYDTVVAIIEQHEFEPAHYHYKAAGQAVQRATATVSVRWG